MVAITGLVENEDGGVRGGRRHGGTEGGGWIGACKDGKLVDILVV